MKELFPAKQVMGFVFSLLLTAVALTVYFIDMSFAVGMTILLSNSIHSSRSSTCCVYACW